MLLMCDNVEIFRNDNNEKNYVYSENAANI
jgi:hypothetical protein